MLSEMLPSVLIIEDHEFDAFYYRRLLSSSYQIELATKATEGLRKAKQDPPDMIILDNSLPDMTGLEVLRKLREFRDLSILPVIMVTGQGSEDIAVEGLKLGIKDYLVKDKIHHGNLTRSLASAMAHAKVNRELQSKQEELENFVSRATHDLRSPFTQIVNITSLIELQYKQDVPEGLQKYLTQLNEFATDSISMVDKLAEYANAGRHSGQFTDVSLKEVLDDVQQKLQLEIETSGAEIRVEPLPEIVGDSVGLTLLFQNLIGNALKYVAPGNKPTIQVKSKPLDNGVQVSVSDNGIGIPQHKASEIFKPFARLHSSDEYAGTGIGLTTCAKIVEQHNGQIGVESKEQEGSNFYFTLVT